MDNQNCGQTELQEFAEDVLMDGNLLQDQWQVLVTQLQDDGYA